MKKILTSFTLVFCLVSVGLYAQTTASGITISDPGRGVEIVAPNDMWSINTTKQSIGLNHETYFDSHITLKKSWYTASNEQDAYKKRVENLKAYLPGAIFIKENETVSIREAVSGLSMTYKNPSDLVVKREIVFVHKDQAFELVFQAKEENFQKVKDDFGFILKNMKLF